MQYFIKHLKLFFDWSEVWAPIIPLFVLLKNKKQSVFLRPVIVYIWVAFFINLFGDIIGDFKKYFAETYWLQKNLYLYNLHSIIRFVCFSYFFIFLKQGYYSLVKKIVPFVYLACIFIDLIFFEDFFDTKSIGANVLSIEAFFLLFYCLLYYLSKLKNENDAIMSGADFYVVTGLSIFVVTNFFVFLFYETMLKEDWHQADNMWSVHNVAYIVFCLLLAKAFSLAKKNKDKAV